MTKSSAKFLPNRTEPNLPKSAEPRTEPKFRSLPIWNDQINSCVNKSSQMICVITRNLISREKSLMLRIYKTLIRPNLEYCVQLWSPAPEHGNWSMILKIEGVQRRFTRMIEDIGLLPYSERLDILGLTKLVERRARGDLIEGPIHMFRT